MANDRHRGPRDHGRASSPLLLPPPPPGPRGRLAPSPSSPPLPTPCQAPEGWHMRPSRATQPCQYLQLATTTCLHPPCLHWNAGTHRQEPQLLTSRTGGRIQQALNTH